MSQYYENTFTDCIALLKQSQHPNRKSITNSQIY